MFDHKHYVPILRWKRSERIALRRLRKGDRIHLTPVVELTPRDFSVQKIKEIGGWDNKLAETAKQLSEHWGQSPFFVDLCHLDPGARSEKGLHPFEVLRRQAQAYQLSLVPVTGLNRTASYQTAIASVVKKDGRDVSIRLHREDIQRSTFPSDLSRLVFHLGLRPTQVHLLTETLH